MSRSQLIRPLSEMFGEVFDDLNVVMDGKLRVITTLEFLQHSLS
jgi:hypothetical protein